MVNTIINFYSNLLTEKILLLTFHIILVGLLSCLVMDLWQRLLKLTYGINPSDWKIIGRWFIYLILKQKLYNPNIENEKPYKNELMIGWVFHYFIGIVYSFGFLACKTWRQHIAQSCCHSDLNGRG